MPLKRNSKLEDAAKSIRTPVVGIRGRNFGKTTQIETDSPCVVLKYTCEDLLHYTEVRTKGLSYKSVRWLNTSRDIPWEKTKGELSTSLSGLRDSVLDSFKSRGSWSKVFGFTVAFLKYLSKVNFDQRYQHLEAHIELPKALRAAKLLTSRIITIEDIRNTGRAIDDANDVTIERKLNYKCMVMFLADSGQRVLTGAQITVSQFKEALRHDPPVLTVEAHQEVIPILSRSDAACQMNQSPE